MFGSTLEKGTCTAFPDVCKTPAPPAGPVPVPYPNASMCNQATSSTAASKVYFDGAKCLVMSSEIPMSSGDEPGVAQGVGSNSIKAKSKYSMGSFKVKAEGKAVVRMSSTTMQNAQSTLNAVGVQSVPSQAKVLILS